MALASGAYGTNNAVTAAAAATFIPEVWSDEIVAAYEKKIVMANLVKRMSMKGKKGDTVHVPIPTRGVANAKAANTEVTIQFDTENEVAISINKHYEYSRLIEDIVEKQAQSSLRRFYTQEAGYALALQKDTDLIQLGRSANNGAGTNVYATAYIGGDGSTLYVAGSNNETAITDAGLRRMIQRLDDNDVPMDERTLVIPPSSRNTLMGIGRFTEQAFVGEVGGSNTIRTGRVGSLYGVEVFVTPNCDTASGSNAARVALLFHKDSAVLVEQMAVRTQTQYKQEHLSDLLTADTLYGVALLRKGDLASAPASMFAIAVPA